jgi:hypothetical protein
MATERCTAPLTLPSTRCLGRDEPEALHRLELDGFQKVLETWVDSKVARARRTNRYRPFEATNVWVRLYWRPSDNRARILFLTVDSAGNRMRYCIPLTGLKVLRTESCLQLCRVNRADGKLDLWANLRFTVYERTLDSPPPSLPNADQWYRNGVVLLYSGRYETSGPRSHPSRT